MFFTKINFVLFKTKQTKILESKVIQPRTCDKLPVKDPSRSKLNVIQSK